MPETVKSAWLPDTDERRKAVAVQLDRILSDPLFSNSKRYPAILRYIVQKTLEGQADQLKERVLGTELFDRKPDYDTASDHVVRTTVGEVRRRLEQYYHKPGHDTEIRIELPVGSFTAEFNEPVPESRPLMEEAAAPPSRARVYWIAAAIICVLVAVVLVGWHPWQTKTDLERFWSPLLDDKETLLICIGRQGAPGQKTLSSLIGSQEDQASKRILPRPDSNISIDTLSSDGEWSVHLADMLAALKIVNFLQSKKQPYRAQGDAFVSFADMQNGPTVLVGGLNNSWTMRLLAQQRFSFASSGTTYCIQDRAAPSQRNWCEDSTKPYTQLGEDHAIISRILDPSTNQWVVTVAGLTLFGTTAASEFLSDPTYMDLANRAPKDWDHKNVQIVITTKVVNGATGPPRIVATYFW